MPHQALAKICLLIVFLSLLMPLNATAQEAIDAFPNELLPDLEKLLTFCEKENSQDLDFDRLPALLEFIAHPKILPYPLSLGDRKGAASDYYEFMIDRPWEQVVDLVYHPTIPSYLTTPSSVRRSHWIEINGSEQSFPRLSGQIDRLDRPLIIKGLEFIENSPDTNTGVYYSYHLERALILFMHLGRRVLISVSNQPVKSQVGKKGLVMGPDHEWNYLYTGEKGSTLPGLSWVDTYMYDSDSIMVYYETLSPQSQVKCAVFKWLNAGWSGINFVRGEHIRAGMERFTRDFIGVVESPQLPDTSTLARMFEQIDHMPTNELKEKTSMYFEKLKQRFKADPDYTKWLTKLFADQTYLESLNRQEMQALVSIEYLKSILGKPHLGEAGYRAPSTPGKKPS